MAIALSMWNFRSWFQHRDIPHIFSIRSNENSIHGVRLCCADAPCDGYALLSDPPAASEYQAVLAYGDDRIFFRTLSPFAVMDEINYMLTVYSHWEQALRRINLSYGSLTSLLALCNELLPCPISIHYGDRLLAASPRHKETIQHIWSEFQKLSLSELIKLVPPESVLHEQYSSTEPIILNSPILHGQQILFDNIVLNRQRYVRITAFAREHSFSPGDIHIMRCLAQVAAQNLCLHQQQFAHSLLNPRTFLTEYIQTGVCDRTQTKQLLRQLNWNHSDKYTVFLAQLKKPSNSIVLDKLYQTLQQCCPAAVCDLCGQSVHLLCNASQCSVPEIRQSIKQILSADVFVVSQSNVGADFSTLPQLFVQAQETLEQARQRKLFFLSSSEIMSDYIYKTLHEHTLIQSMVHPAVRILHTADLQQQSHYSETLNVYLQFGENCNAAAKALHIHRNTLLNRLERIRALTGITLEDPQEQEALRLSLMVADYPT